MIQVNEDKDTTFDLKDAESDDEDYKGDIKSKDYENEKLQKVEKLTSPSAPSPDDSEKVKNKSSKTQTFKTLNQAGGSTETKASDWRPGTATLAWAPGNLTPVVP